MAKRIKIIPVLDTKTLFKQLKQLGNRKQTINVNVNGSGINNTVQQLHQMNSAGNSSTSIFGKLKSVIKDTFSEGKIVTTAYLAVLNMIYSAGKNAVKTTEELNKSMVDLQIASDMDKESVKGLIGEYNRYAKELSSTTLQVSKASDAYIRAGKSMEESQALIEKSIMLSKLGQIDADEATTDLLSTMNAYEMSIEEVGRALDAMVAIDMKASTSAGDIAKALRYCASNADLAGLSFNKLISILSTIQHKTGQSAEVVGNTMNTVLSRYKNVKLGALTDDDGEDISNVETSLKSLGIQLRNSAQDFRDFEEVFPELGRNWSNYTEVQQASIAKELGGVRQMNRVIAMFEGYNKILELTEVAANSAGTAVEKFNNSYINSIEAKKNKLQASFETMVLDNQFEDVYGGILDSTTALVDFINQTNALKGVATSLAVVGFIKGFLSIRTGINDAYISLNQFQNALNIVKQTKISTQDFDRLLLLSNKLTDSQIRLIISSKNLSVVQKEDLLVARGLSREESKLRLQTLGVTAAQTGLTASTTSLKMAAKGLLSYIAANPLTVLISGITMASMAFNAYKNHVEEVRRATEESATTYKESTSSIDDYVAKYQDLRQALLEAKGDEQATYDVKKQLLDLQNELNEKFGTEASKINLVSDAYRDQTEAIKAYNKELASRYLNENRKGIQTATKQMTKTREYTLSDNSISLDTASGKAVNDIVQKYSDKGMSLLDSGAGTYQVVIKADAENAYEAINDFSNDLRERAKELGNEHLFDGILDISSKALNDAKDTVEDYGDIYKQSLMANLVSDDDMSAVYNEALNAVEQYNNAVASSTDIYSDANVINAKKNLDEVRAKIDGNLAEWGKYSSITDDLFEQVDTKLLDFNENLKNNSRLIVDALSLKTSNYDDLDLQSFNPGENQAFDRLKASAEEYGLSVEQLIDALVRLGYVQGEVSKQTPSVTNFDSTAFLESVSSIQSGYEKLLSAQNEFNEYGSITASTLKDLMENDLIQYLQFTADGLSINTQALEDNEQALKDTATAELYNAMCNDIQNLSLGDTASLSNIAQTAIANLDSVATIAGKNASIAAQGWWEYGASIQSIPGVSDLTGDNYKKAEAVVNQYKNIANSINSLSIGNTNSSKSSAKSATKDAEQATKEYIDSYMNYMETSLESGRIDYQTYSHDVSKFLKDMYDQGKIAAKDYHDYTKQMLEVQKSAYDKVISAVTHKIEQQIKVLEKQKKSIESNYQSKIDAIQAEIDALEEANTKRKEQMELERLQYEAERARNQRTQLQYIGGQMAYTTDTSAIRDAEEEVAQKQHDMRIAELESQIKRLEEAMKAETDAIDSQIEKLNEYKDKWNEISEQYEIAQNEMIAQQILGADWESEILSGRLDVLNAFAESYFAIQQALADAAWASANEQIKAAQEAEKGAGGTPGGSEGITPTVAKPSSQIDWKDPITNKTGKGRAPKNPGYSIMERYASGTRNAKKGIAEVAENGSEIITDGKTAVLAETPTLVNMKGGETVYNADETEKLLNSKGLVRISQEEYMESLRTSHRIPGKPEEFLHLKRNEMKLQAARELLSYTPKPYSEIDKSMDAVKRNINNINNSNNTQNVTVGDVHVHSYGITKAEVAKEVGVELHNQFRGLSLNAYQRSNISR